MAAQGVDPVGDDRPGIEIRLLGPLEVDVDGARAELGGPRPRALLSLLALEAPAPVSVIRIVETLWDGQEPDGARNAVQVYASRLRKSLGVAGSAVRAVPGGYVLHVPAARVDANRFEQLVDAGQAQLTGGDPASAVDTLGRALALWRGDALVELGPAGDGLRARLEARRLAARTGLVEAELARGQHATVLPTVEELVRRHPLDEHLVACLMTALYRCGRQADALSAFAAAVQRLDDELGVDPGAELCDVHEQVLRHEVPHVAAPAAPAAAALPTASAPTLVACTDPVRDVAAALPPGRGLGRPRLPLVGRSADLDLAGALLADPRVRVVTLVGLGGMGKTRLSLEVARRHAADREALVVALAGTEDPAAVLPAVCRAAGLAPDWVREPPLEVAVRGLAGRRVLLVLDNLEQLLDRPGFDGAGSDVAGSGSDDVGLAVLDELLDRLPELTLLCTSRTPVGLAGEFLVPLGPLPVPPAGVVEPAEVLSYDAVRLFRERARAAMPGFDVTRENAADVATVCRMLDGLPLALELAAARVRLLPPATIAHRGDGRLTLLAEGPRHLPDRHRSIRAALDWSVALLDDDEKDVFARLSVFAGGWTLQAAEQVCAGADLDAPAALAVVGRLVDKSLVVADGSGRMWMLELVREYAAGLLAQAPGDALTAAGNAHRDYVLDLAERLALRLGGGLDPATRATLDAEAANFAVALGRLQAAGDTERLARLVVVLLEYWFYSGALADADRWLAVAQAPDVPARTRAKLHMTAGSLAFVSGDLRTARTEHEAAVAVAADLGDDMLLARNTTMLAVIDRYGGARDVALDRLAVARGFAERAASSAVLAVIDNERGEILLDLGRTAQARPLIQTLHDRARADQSLDQVATTGAHLALLSCADGDDVQARELIGTALTTAEETGVTPALADVLLVAGILELRLGEPATAVQGLRRALRVTRQVSLLVSLPGLVSLLGAALVRTGDLLAGARILAAGRAWRAARGMAVLYTLAAALVDAAEAEVDRRLAPDALRAATAAGEAAPFGSLDAVEALARATVVDIRQAGTRRASSTPS